MELHNKLKQNLRKILNVPSSHTILLLSAGARGQFSALPLNCAEDKGGIYLISGYWSAEAAKFARRVINVYTFLIDHKQKLLLLPEYEEGYPQTRHTGEEKLKWQAANILIDKYKNKASYMHCCYNETVDGVQFPSLPDSRGLPLAVDISSCIAAYPLDFAKMDIAYACAQKNLGIAGLTFVSIKTELLRCQERAETPAILSYSAQAKEDSLLNTPVTFASYVSNLVCEWIIEQGGVEKLGLINKRKADAIYNLIDNSGGFYLNHIPQDFRSITNIVFNLAEKKLEDKFIREAYAKDMINLRGHRIIGGIRASIYNGITEKEIMTFCEFMEDFKSRHI